MPRLSPNTAALGLIGCGVVVCFFTGKPLARDTALCVPPNPLGIKMSPYGEVIAMAMQGPIDLYWHAGSDECHDPNCTEHHHHGGATGSATHDHDDDCDRGPECTHDHRAADPTLATSAERPASGSLRDQYRGFLEGLNNAVSARTNPRSATDAHKFFLRRQVENKLRFAYQLDPAHYGNYSSYHFFVTQPQIGTRPELTAGAKQLADATIAYCLNQSGDPRPALTAAAAAENVLELMFGEPARYPVSNMREQLALVDHCLARYRQMFDQSVESGQWNLLSTFRQDETLERARFLSRVRDASEATIRRLEGLPAIQQATSN